MSRAAASAPAPEVPRLYSNPIRLAAHAGVQLKELKALPIETVAAAVDDAGMTPLAWAARTGDLEVCKWLLETVHADVNVASASGATPLMLACGGAHEFVVVELLRLSRANPAAVDECGNAALHFASKGGSLSCIQALIEAGGVDLLGVRNKAGRTALFTAATHGQAAVVTLLLKAGAKADETDARGSTPLHAAAAAGFPRICEALLEAGASRAAKDADGHTAADVAVNAAVKAVFERPASGTSRGR